MDSLSRSLFLLFWLFFSSIVGVRVMLRVDETMMSDLLAKNWVSRWESMSECPMFIAVSYGYEANSK